MTLPLKEIKIAVLLIAAGMGTSGCVAGAIAAAGAGYVIADEQSENDGNFDPLENVRGKGDGKN